jgi:hypothetical protein
LVVSEYGLNEAVLYINDGLAYLPVCTNVSTIQVLNKTNECYRDFAVKYSVGNNEVNGFLRHSNILSQFSDIVNCKSSKRNLVIESSLVRLKRIHKAVTVESFSNQYALKLRIPLLKEGSLNEIFKHHQFLVNSTGTIDHIEELLASQEKEDIFYVRSIKNSTSETKGPVKYVERAYIWLGELGETIWNFIIYISLARLVIAFCLLVILWFCFRKNPNTRSTESQ